MIRAFHIVVLGVMFCCNSSASAQALVPMLGGPNAPTASMSSHSERCLAALRLADEAAQAGLMDVSIEAVKRAIGEGPPVEAVKLGTLLGGSASQNRNAGNSEADVSDQNALSLRLAELDATWMKVKADPEEIYNVWREIVFPTSFSSEAFAYGIVNPSSSGGSYSLNLKPSKPPPMDESGCRALVVWAEKAGKTEELKQFLKEREGQPASRPVVLLAQLLLAIDDESIDREAVCSAIARNAQNLVTGRDAHQTSYFVSQLVEKLPLQSPARRRLVDGIAAAALADQRAWMSNQWLRYLIAKETEASIKADDWERFNLLFGVMESILDPIRSGNEDYVQQTVSRAYGAAAGTAFQASHLGFGLRCLKLQVASSGGSTSSSSIPSTLLDVNDATFRELLGMSYEVRYETLGDLVWSMPMLGITSLATFAPREEFPKRFVENYKSYRKQEQLPVEQACSLGSQSMSVLEWVMRDAIALGKESEIRERIAKLHKDGSDDAVLADFVWAKAQGKPVDVGKLMVTDADGKRVLRPEVEGSRGPLSPLDLDIVSAAIRSPDTYSAGLDLANRLTDRALANRTNAIAHTRRILADAQLLGDTPPKTSSALKHFVATSDYRIRAVHSGQPRESYWLKREDGNWEHRASPARSMLLLKYPLEGDFKITFDCKDGTYAESATTALGLNIDFRGYLTDVAVEYVGERGNQQVKAESMKRGELNSVEIEHSADDGTLSLTLNDSPVAVFRADEATFPFVGPQSMMHRQMALENFKITGSPKIPRSVELLSPSLVGWSNLFHSRRLPTPADLRYDSSTGAGNGEEAGADTSGENSPETEQPKSAVVGYDWENKAGVLQTIDHVARADADQKAGIKSTKRFQREGEEWIYYIRPLCDGETVDFEFYQEADSFSLHPTIDRIALQLGQQLREHWIISDARIFGIAPSNRRDVASDQVLGKVQLLEKQWNKASMRRSDDMITLAINGNDVYQQKVDPAYGGRFGFMGNPNKFQVKVRSVTLRGDWPETLPTDLFEEK